MHRVLATATLLLIGCSEGPNPETLIDELRIVASVAEPPEVGAGESVLLATTVADPVGAGFEVLTWTCTRLGEGCSEADLGDLASWATIDPVDKWDTATAERTISPAVGALLSDELPELPVQVFALACEPGLCPVIDTVRSAPEPDSAAWDALADDLANPFDFMSTLPFEGVTLATRTLRISNRPVEERHVNPVLTVTEVPGDVDPSDSVEVTFSVEGAAEPILYGYSTAGGFGSSAVEVLDGLAALTWFAPEEPGSAELFVVAQDELGGSAIWRGDARAE